ncbi:hypothetical protein ACFOQM_03860 [Paenibacillus sp. GCM10012307]|uniref:hypothetical protein n=1 Tax=Paenibacillus TaxID=44249 RepID=UPI001E4A0906|nr:hypothetical protein [Paenibacillus roseus]
MQSIAIGIIRIIMSMLKIRQQGTERHFSGFTGNFFARHWHGTKGKGMIRHWLSLGELCPSRSAVLPATILPQNSVLSIHRNHLLLPMNWGGTWNP